VIDTAPRRVSGARARLLAVLLAGLLLLSVGACTGGQDPKPSAAPATASHTPPTPTAPTAPPSVPMRVQVTHVAGALTPARRTALANAVRRTLSTYLDAAFLAGSYPRSRFADAFRTFTRGAARQARGDLALLTNQPLGATTRSVRATRRTAYLSVLAPRQHVAGVTAAVNLVFLVDRDRAPAERVAVRGRLLLTRGRAGPWKIFGYDVTRSEARARGAR
jgi:hypothetical protein